MMLSDIIIFCLTFQISRSDQNDEKRLLLTEPSSALDRLAALENVIRQQADTIIQLRSETKRLNDRPCLKETGSTYVRWGRKQCPNDAELVYSGFAGGGSYDQSGSASDYVCLSLDPVFNKTTGPDYGRMYGAEYASTLWASATGGQQVPCALCRTSYATSVMIPGTSECSNGWRTEYHGYLAAGNYRNAAASSFVCVDINPEHMDVGHGFTTGKLFYGVVAVCGSLPCPPYIDNNQLTCVVCSK